MYNSGREVFELTWGSVRARWTLKLNSEQRSLDEKEAKGLRGKNEDIVLL